MPAGIVTSPAALSLSGPAISVACDTEKPNFVRVRFGETLV